MGLINMLSVVEAFLFISNESVSRKKLSEVLEITELEVARYLDSLMKKYNQDKNSGIQIIEVSGGYRMATKPNTCEYIEKYNNKRKDTSLSQASLETLAIVMYNYPITRVEIESIRGVNCEKSIRSLIEKNLIKDIGRKETPGRPIIYGITKHCLDYFGLNSTKDLPSLDSFNINFNN